MAWFERNFGFEEKDYEDTRAKFAVSENDDGEVTLVSKVSGRSFFVGSFTLPSVSELRRNIGSMKSSGKDDGRGLTFENIGACARALHMDPRNNGAVFQVASQFNMLEMVGPSITPDKGVTRYCYDRTQGPACALAAPAGTVYRNYFVNKFGQGGSKGRQLNGCADIAKMVGNETKKMWTMRNGYLLPVRKSSMAEVGAMLAGDAKFRDKVVGSLKVGVHWSTEVERTKRKRPSQTEPHRVTQIFCSALPIAYDKLCKPTDWNDFACAILDGAYEATLAVAATISQREERRRVTVFLTQVGGGVFGNRKSWIASSLARAMDLHAHFPLDVKLVHYGSVPPNKKNPFVCLERVGLKRRREGTARDTKTASGGAEAAASSERISTQLAPETGIS